MSVSAARARSLVAVLRAQVYCDADGRLSRPDGVSPQSLTAAFTAGLCRWTGLRYDDLAGCQIDTAELTDRGVRALRVSFAAASSEER
jgi:hypothetical protein